MVSSAQENHLLAKRTERTYLSIVLIVFLGIHALLFFYDISNAKAFLEGDRAAHRMTSIVTVLDSLKDPSSIMDTLIARGVPGDYIFHVMAYSFYGSYTVILFQILLGLVAVVYVYQLAQLLFSNPILSTIAAISYILLPGSLVHPHTLVTEAFYNPLLVISFYYSLKYIMENGRANIIIAGLTASIAAFIRLIFILFPFIYFGIILFSSKGRKFKDGLIYLTIVFTIPVIWMSMNFVHTGDFAMGGSRFSRNLYRRVERMANLEPIDLDEYTVWAMDVDEFFEYLSQHPASFIKTLQADIYNLGLNTGVNTFAGRYMGLYEMAENKDYWKNVRDQQGLTGAFIELFNWSPLLIGINLIATVLWLLFLIFSFYGFILFLKDKQFSNIIKFTVLIFPIYIISTQFIASTPRWSHRTPTEFIFSIMFALASLQVGNRIKDKKTKVIAK